MNSLNEILKLHVHRFIHLIIIKKIYCFNENQKFEKSAKYKLFQAHKK